MTSKHKNERDLYVEEEFESEKEDFDKDKDFIAED
jgi:hypothetical protein